MACFAFVVVILSLFCLFPGQEYHLNQWASSSTINELLSSKILREDSPIIG